MLSWLSLLVLELQPPQGTHHHPQPWCSRLWPSAWVALVEAASRTLRPQPALPTPPPSHRGSPPPPAKQRALWVQLVVSAQPPPRGAVWARQESRDFGIRSGLLTPVSCAAQSKWQSLCPLVPQSMDRDTRKPHLMCLLRLNETMPCPANAVFYQIQAARDRHQPSSSAWVYLTHEN